MKNKRCRLHGGLSTGPKTEEGLARSRMANFKHGRYSPSFQEKLKREKQWDEERRAYLEEMLAKLRRTRPRRKR